ncbi:MAG: ABC1 kinase family protein [Acidimicrobiales bacterium]
MPDTSLPSDLSFGSFTESGPWTLDPERIEWLPQTAALRTRNHASVPELIRRRRIPPARRVLGTGYRLGSAILLWRLIERRSGGSNSRRGLSRRLRRAFEALGPTYIKLGQIISAGEGLFPEELVSEFRLLRDHVTPEPFATVRATIESDLHQPLEAIFSHFERTPLAAASIAQVHRATLRTGQEVVVKVQRASVSTLVRRDLAAMAWIAPQLIGRIPVAALANPPAFVELFADTIVEELDFRLEAANMLDIAKILATTDQRALVVPRPHPRYVTRRVLVMERLQGFVWDDVDAMHEAGIDTTKVLRAAMVSFLEGATVHGVFHGDLHGGNLLVLPDGSVGLLDFGMTGRLPERKRLAFLRMLLGGTVNNVAMQVSALCDLGALPSDTNVPEIISELGLDKPAVDPTQMSPEQLLAEIREITKSLLEYGATLPKELMLFVKNMLFLNASIAVLAPDIDLFGEISYLVAYFTSKYGQVFSQELGMDVTQTALDLDGVRNSLGLDAEVSSITYRELQERREVIRKRMEEHRQRSRRRLLGRAKS